MSQPRLSCLPLLATAAIIASTLSHAAPAASLPTYATNGAPQADAQARANYGKLPISFEANRGQTDPEVRYLSRSAGFSLFLTPTEAVLSLKASAEENSDTAVVRLSLVGGNRNPAMQAIDQQASKTNYFVGNDSAKWQRDLANFARVKYSAVYPGVDLVYYGNQMQLEYDFLVAPGADPSQIALNIDGAKSLKLDAQGNLVLGTNQGDIVQHAPIAYQQVNGTRHHVDASYAMLADGRVGFNLGAYDKTTQLVIDPILVYSTYIGGTLGDRALDIAIDSSQNAYITGFANSSIGFPTKNAYQATSAGAGEVFVTKLSSAGALVYSTYIGGQGTDEAAGIAIDSAGNAYVTGRTNSLNYPVVSAYQSALGGSQDAFLTKLNASGNGLVYSTFLGGNTNTTYAGATGEYGYGVAVDASGSAYVAGWTASTNFPTVNPFQANRSAAPAGCDAATDANKCARSEAFVSKFSASGTSLIYSTYLGGTEYDEAYGIAIDGNGSAYVTGTSTSANFPTLAPKQVASGGNGDAFVAKLSAAGNSLAYSTFLGGVGQDLGYSLVVDSTGSAYVAGVTASANFPVVTPAQAFNAGLGGSQTDGFVTKVSPTGNAWVYSTFIGGSGGEAANGIAVDSAGNAYIAGQSNSTTGFPISNAIQASNAGFYDGFLVKLSASGSTFIYGTFLGGSGDDYGTELAVDASGDAYIVGYSSSSNFPVLKAAQGTNKGSQDAFVSRVSSSSDATISVNNVNIAEGNSGTSVATFTVSLSRSLPNAVDFNIATGGGTATAGNDYVVMSLTGQSIPAGTTSKTFTVTINGDTTVESDETFFVNLSAVSGALIGDGQGTGTIVNDDAVAPLSLSVADTSVMEGNSGTTAATFTVTLSSPSASTVTFNIATADGSAVSGSDYTSNSATNLSIAAGATTRTFTVSVIGDTITEPNETFFVNLSNAVGASISDGTATGNINNDDNAPLPAISVSDVSVTEGNSGTSLATFTVSLSEVAQATVGFNVVTSNVTAASGTDYVAVNLPGQSIPAGMSNKTFSVTINGDTAVESNETFNLNVTNVTGATIADSQGVGTILNDDSAVLPAISIGNVTVTEGNSGTSSATFTVQLNAVPASTVSFDIATANGSAAAGSDFVGFALAGQTMAAGQTSKNFVVTINGDTAVEADETFTVNVTNASGATISDGSATGNILNDDTVSAPPPQISVSDVTTTEGNSGTKQMTFTVSLSASATAPVSFDVQTSPGTAAAGSDYTHLSLTGQTIAAGQTSANFSVTINGDTAVESDETFNLNVTNATGATIADSQGVGTIVNDDSAPPPAISIGNVTVTEGNSGTSSATFTVQLNAVPASTVSFDIATANGSAAAGSDFVALALAGQTMAAGQTSKNFAVTINGDTTVEADETFTVNVTNASGATISDGSATGNILNDDTVSAPPPQISVSDVTTTEGNSGTKQMTFTVSLSASATAPVSFDVQTSPGTAAAGSDYTHLSLTGQTIAAGQTSANFSVTINGDTAVESDETFNLNVTNATGATIADSQGVGTIVNDDSAPPPAISIGNVTVTEGNSGTSSATFTVQLNAVPASTVSFDIATANGSAAAGSDFVALALAGQTMAAGQTSKNFAVTINGDTTVEADETFTVNVTNASGATISDGSATGNIVNDDTLSGPPPQISVSNVTMAEGNSGTKLMTFTVSLSASVNAAVNFDVWTSPGTAAAGSDYTHLSLTGQTIAAGQTSANFSVSVTGDASVEANETFTLNLNNVSGASVVDAQGLGTISNDDFATLTVHPTTIVEGNSGFSTASFLITLSTPMPSPVTFNISTSNGTANQNSDYEARNLNGALIDAGRTRMVFEVKVFGDSTSEGNETFNVSISGVSGAGITTSSGVGTITNDDTAATSIPEIQGVAQLSPLDGKDVSTTGVVTAIDASGFYLQASDSEQDGNALTAEGLYVAGKPEVSIMVGDRVEVSGRVIEAVVGDEANQLTQTQIALNKVSVLANAQALPRAIELDATVIGSDPSITSLERFEGMRVSVPKLTVVGPTGGRIDEASNRVRGDGKFYGVLRGVARPFLEAGLNAMDRASAAGVSPQVFDTNPERLLIDSLAQRGATALSADAGDNVRGLVGVLGYGQGAYRLLPDPSANVDVVSGAAPKAVSAAASGEATIASFNLRRFLDDSRTGSEPVLGATAYATRLAKTANVICAFAKTPDILGLAEVENRNVLGDIAAAVNAKDGNLLFPGSCAGQAAYRATTPAAASGKLGFLVNTAQVRPGVARVEVLSVMQSGATSKFRQRDGSSESLHVQAPLVMEARINAANGSSTTVTVVSAQLSALDGNLSANGAHGWSTRGAYLRSRRAAQAAYIASLVQSLQSARPDAKLVLLGDFEAAQFNDGRNDLMGIVSGRTAPRAQVLGYVASPVTNVLTNLTTRLPAAQRYTVIRQGNAQAVDHILVNNALLRSSPAVRAEVARINADFGEDNFADAGVPMRVSDHDPVVMYFDIK